MRAATCSGRASVAGSASGSACAVHQRCPSRPDRRLSTRTPRSRELGRPQPRQVVERGLRDRVGAPALVGVHARVRADVHDGAGLAQRHRAGDAPGSAGTDRPGSSRAPLTGPRTPCRAAGAAASGPGCWRCGPAGRWARPAPPPRPPAGKRPLCGDVERPSACASPPACADGLATLDSSAAERATSTTRAPAAASCSASARPSPRLAPVTNADCSCEVHELLLARGSMGPP